MTQKGLAIGAASSLLLAGFVGTPAFANGLADTTFVSLTPNVGSEYDVLTGSSREFALKANAASSVLATGAYLKFLVTDSSGTVTADQGAGKSTTYEVATTAWSQTGTPNVITATVASHKFKVGDRVTFSSVGRLAVTGVVLNTTTATLVRFEAASAGSPATEAGKLVLAPNAVNTDTTSFVYQTRLDAQGSDQVLVLETANAETAKRTVTVRAWVDSNGNDRIDSTEYASPVRTINWNRAADVEVATSLVFPTAGDSSVSATLTLTPNLNEEQLTAGDIKVGFTRPGSTATIYANATQNDTSRAWSASQSLVTGNWAGMPHIAQIQSISNANPSLFTVSPAIDIAVADVVTTAGTTAGDGSVAGTVVASAPSTSTFTLTGVQGTAQASAAGHARVVSRELVGVSATATALTYTTVGAHGLSIGDIVTIDASNTTNSAQFDRTRAVVASVPSATSFTVSGTGFTVVSPATTDDTGDVTYVSFIEAVPGSYSAKGNVLGTDRGNTSTNVTVANTANDTTLATTATANVQGVSNTDATGTSTAYVRRAQTSVELTATVVDENDVAVSAGRTVKVSLENLQGNGGGNRSGTFTVNGTAYTSDVFLRTDANGKVTFTVADNDGALGTQVRVLVVPENLSGAKTADIELLWADAVYTIVDLNDNADAAATGHNSVVAGGSYAYSIAVLDQWKTAPAAGSHRVKYETTGNTVATNYITLTNGRGTYSVTDNSVGGGSSIQTVFSLEKLGTDGVTWTAQDLLNDGNSDGAADTLTYTTSVVSSTATFSVQLDTDGSTAFGAGAAADLSNTASTVQVVAQDRRTSNAVQPVYGSPVRVTGRVANASTNAPRAGAEVTITGPASILFSEGAVDGLGSLTFKTDASGEFGINLYSTTVQTDTVITVTSGAATRTVKVSFTGQGASFGTAWVITAPTSALPGSTFQFKAKLVDKFNNPVQVSTAGDVKVTYTGPGLIVGTLPNTTDKDGELTFAVLLGTNDRGTAAITLSYDQNSDDDFVDAKDIVTARTITVGTAAAASGGKVNVGSFNGKLVVYASGLNGARISWKVGGNWGSQVASSNYAIFNRPTPRAGVTVSVEIFVNGVSTLTKSVVTR